MSTPQAHTQPTAVGLWLDTPADFEAVAQDVQNGLLPEYTGRLGSQGPRPLAGEVYVVAADREGPGAIKRWTDCLTWGPSSTRHKDAITYYPPSDGNSDSCAKDIRKQRYIAKVKLHRNSEQSRDWLVVSYVWHDQRRNKAGLRKPGVSSATDHSLGLHLGAGYPVGSLHLHAQPISPVAATGSPAHIPGQELFPSTPTQTPYSPTLTSAQRWNPVTIVSPPKPNRPDIITLPRISELNHRTQDLASRFNGGSITNSPTPRSPIDEQVLRRLHAAP